MSKQAIKSINCYILMSYPFFGAVLFGLVYYKGIV